MNIQEQLEKIESSIDKLLDGIDKDECESKSGWWETSTGAEFGVKIKSELKVLLHTSAPKLLKTAYEEERERLEKMKDGHTVHSEPPCQECIKEYGHNQALTDTITHLNTKIAEVNELMK